MPEMDTATWVHHAATVMQHVVMHLHEAVREDFETAFRTFARELPEPRSRLEALWLHETTASLRLKAAVGLDAQHHLGRAACLPHFMRTASAWVGRSTFRFQIRRWLRSFLRTFDDDHGLRIPVGAATFLLRQALRQVRSEEIATVVACDLSVLKRTFQSRYQLTPNAFHQRVRTRHAATTLRASDDKVVYVAAKCGWWSAANLYAALDRAVGMTPTEIRTLSDDRFSALLEGPLQTSPGRLARTGDPNAR
jgi:AraC-like DNA-binding protein